MKNPEKTNNQRVYYLDWLRVLSVIILVFFHVARIFDSLSPFYIKNSATSVFFDKLIIFINHWQLPLFFLISGAAAWFSLQYRSWDQYLRERMKRLIVPFLFGLIIVVPPQLYFVLKSNPDYVSSYWDFLGSYFINIDPNYPLGGNYTATFELAHLWFLGVLFLFSILLLPLFLYIKKRGLANMCEQFSPVERGLSLILLLAVPIIVVNVLTHALLAWSFLQNPFVYFLFFAYGFFLFSNPNIEKIIEHNGKLSLLTAILTSVLLLFLFDQGWRTNGISIIFFHAPFSQNLIKKILFELVSGANFWFWTVSLLSLGQKCLNFSNKFLQYFTKAILPIYILHQTFIVAFGFYIIRWSQPIFIKYLAISLSSFGASIVFYEFIIKRINIVRLLFGMRAKK